MMEDSDAAWVTRVREGDEESFRVLVERHSVKLFRLAFRMTGNEQDAEDIVQETFLRAYRQLRNFEARAGFGTWLHRIAANCSVDLLRKRQRRDAGKSEGANLHTEALAETASQGPTPDQQLHHTEIQQRIESAMEQLTSLERTAFVLRHFEGRSIEEISAALGAGPSATKQSIFRAVQKVRGSLEPVVNATV